MLKTIWLFRLFVLPDNVLFEDHVRKQSIKSFMETTTSSISRLPTAIFCANGVKANVLFFDGKPPPKLPGQRKLDLRLQDQHPPHTKEDPLKPEDLSDFIKCYNPKNRNKRKELYMNKITKVVRRNFHMKRSPLGIKHLIYHF